MSGFCSQTILYRLCSSAKKLKKKCQKIFLRKELGFSSFNQYCVKSVTETDPINENTADCLNIIGESEFTLAQYEAKMVQVCGEGATAGGKCCLTLLCLLGL